jgi:hypothetical protein
MQYQPMNPFIAKPDENAKLQTLRQGFDVVVRTSTVGNVLRTGDEAVPQEPLARGKCFRRQGFRLDLRRPER